MAKQSTILNLRKYIGTVGASETYIQSLFPSRGAHDHFLNSHNSNKLKEGYEFNIKCCARTAPWIKDNWEAYHERMSDELENFVEMLKDDYPWLEEAFTAGRSGGWLVITTYDRVYEGWEESERLMTGKETIKRANDLRKIENSIKNSIHRLENMTDKQCEHYWAEYKPEDWEEQVKQKEETQRIAAEARKARCQEVIDYTPDMETFYMLTDRMGDKYLVNDRGDIVGNKRHHSFRFSSYGQAVPGNPYTGWNRIIQFSGSGIAPKRILFKDAYKKGINGLHMFQYNAPSGQYTDGGQEIVSMWKVSKETVDREMGYAKKSA